MKKLLLLAMAGVLASPAHAARPMITDDARLTDAQACQVESWLKFNRGGTEKWALPACNPGGNLELTLGGALGEDGQGARTTDVVLQGKTLLKPLEANSWGLGLTLGMVAHPAISPTRNLSGDVYFNLPASLSLRDDALVLHLNLGALHIREEGATRATWGLGSETRLDNRNLLIAEAFGQDRGRPYYQLGLRHWIVPERVQVDATVGNRFGMEGEERWFSLGLRLISPRLMR